MDDPVRRRGFLKSLAAAPLALLNTPQTTTPPSPAPSPASLAEAEVETAKALTEVVRHRYGAHLDAASLEEIRKGIEGSLQAAARLRLDLGNADEPVTLFHAGPPRHPRPR